jgi:hypothetical protein
MIFHHLIPVPSGYRSLYFNRKEVIAFLKTLDYYYKDHGINNDLEKKERAIEYLSLCLKRDIKRLLEFKDSTT